jgi:hypothetical protein
MSIRKLFSTIFGMAVLSTLAVLANAQMTEQAAREQAGNIVRSELQATLRLKPDQFLVIHRDEELEQSLAIAVGEQPDLTFIYKVSPEGVETRNSTKVSPEGVEIREHTVVYHVWTDIDLLFIIVVNPRDGSTYRIHGFGLTESLAEFQRLMKASKMRVLSPDQAESLADFYRAVNPENQEDLTPILNLMELKQAAERQCQSGVKSFDADEKAFAAWWKHAKPLYAEVSFKQTAVPLSSGYFVEWIVLSSAAKGNCGGAPLRLRLAVSSDGHVDKLTASPLPKS